MDDDMEVGYGARPVQSRASAAGARQRPVDRRSAFSNTRARPVEQRSSSLTSNTGASPDEQGSSSSTSNTGVSPGEKSASSPAAALEERFVRTGPLDKMRRIAMCQNPGAHTDKCPCLRAARPHADAKAIERMRQGPGYEIKNLLKGKQKLQVRAG